MVGMSAMDAIAATCTVKVEWDIMEGAESYTADSRELASIICAKLNQTLSEGKDSILQAVAENNMDDTSALLEAAEISMMVNAEGYSRYKLFEAFRTLNDLHIGLKQNIVADLGTITGSILAAGLGTQKDITVGDWPLILDCDSWFRFAISTLGNIAKAGARFKDFPSRGNHALLIDSEHASFTLRDEFEVPVTQSEMMWRLLKQIYAQLDERNDTSALEEWAKYLQDKSLDSFEWLTRARVALKSVFLGQYLPETDIQAIMEMILQEWPKAEIMEELRARWCDEVDNTIQREGNRFKKDMETTLARNKQLIEEDYVLKLEEFKKSRKLYYDGLDKVDQCEVVTQQAIALSLIEHAELQERDAKKVKTSRSSSIVSLSKKRGRSVSRSEDLQNVNLVAYSTMPSQKMKDGSITPTRASVDVPIIPSQGLRSPIIASDRESFPPPIQLLSAPLVMQVDDTPPSITPSPLVLAALPVAKPTKPELVSSLASSMHVPGNTMDVSEDFPTSTNSPTKPTTSDTPKTTEEKFEIHLSGMEAKLVRIA